MTVYCVAEKTTKEIIDSISVQLFIARTKEIFELYKFEWMDRDLGGTKIPTREDITTVVEELTNNLIEDEECFHVSSGRVNVEEELVDEEFNLYFTLDIG